MNPHETQADTHRPSDANPGGATGQFTSTGTNSQTGSVSPLGRIGKFELLHELGRGGMGCVYAARDTTLDREVALKFMLPDVARDPIARERFTREARAVAALRHDHVVEIYEVGSFTVGEQTDVPFFVMPKLLGETLKSCLDRAGRLSVAETVRIGREIASGPAALHGFGRIHRDIKPANVWLEAPAGRVKLLDFGLARTIDGRDLVTTEHASMGTPAYMSPEQIEARDVDGRTDLFSLGVVLYQLTTGVLPFAGPTLGAVMSRVLTYHPPAPHQVVAEVPEWLSDLIMSLLSKDAEGRPASAEVVEVALRTMTFATEAQQTVVVAPAGTQTAEPTISLSPLPTKSRRWLWMITAGALAALMLGMAVCWWPQPFIPETTPTPDVVRWVPGPAENVLPGAVARPAEFLGVKRWQIQQVFAENCKVAWSPDGKLIAYGDRTGKIRLYDAVTRQIVRWIPAHNNRSVTGLEWSPDGKWLASSSPDVTVRLWRADGSPGPVFIGHTGVVLSISWCPDSKRLASGGFYGDATVRIWELDGKRGPVLKCGNQSRVAWSPDGSRLAVADGYSMRTSLWDTGDWSQIATLGPTPTNPQALAWSPDSKYLATSGGDFQAGIGGWVWDVRERKKIASLQGMGSWINWLGWTPDGKLASASQDRFLALLDPQSGNIISRTPQAGHSLVSACWSPDGKRIADTDGRIWTLPEPGRESELGRICSNIDTVGVPDLAWSPDGRKLASASRAGLVRQWSPSGFPEQVYNVGEKTNIYVAWEPDQTGLVIAGGNALQFWEVDGTAGRTLSEHTGKVRSVAWSPDGKQLASGSEDKTVRLWQADGTPGPCLTGHQGIVWSVSWSADGQRLASGSADKTIRLWQADGTVGPILQGHEEAVRRVVWQPSGKLLASASFDKTIRLWHPDGTAGSVLRGHEGRVQGLAWSPDGKQLISGGDDRTVRLWQVDGTPGPVLSSLEAAIWTVDWSSDGKKIAIGDDHGKLLVVNPALEPEWTALILSDGKTVSFSLAGEVLDGDSAVIEKELIYVVERPDGRCEVYKPSEFLKMVGALKADKP